MNKVVISFGSNINPQENIAKAKKIISQNHSILAESHFLETEPIGNISQPNYINGVTLIETDMDQEDLRNWLKKVEKKLGRVRVEKYGPRTIDLDIVVWNDKVVDKDVYDRDFLRIAVLEVCPELNIQ